MHFAAFAPAFSLGVTHCRRCGRPDRWECSISNAGAMIPCYCWLKTALTSGRPMEAMVIRDACRGCGSQGKKKNGHTRHGKQNHQCKACERQFGATAEDYRIAEAQR